jgi:hypothetical protein
MRDDCAEQIQQKLDTDLNDAREDLLAVDRFEDEGGGTAIGNQGLTTIPWWRKS